MPFSDLGKSLLFLTKSIAVFSDVILPDNISGTISGNKEVRSPPNYTISGSWVFDNFILADELFANALWSLETWLSVKNDLCRKLVSSLEPPNDRFKVTSVRFFIPDFDLLSCKLDNFTFKVLCWVILYWYYIKKKQI